MHTHPHTAPSDETGMETIGKLIHWAHRYDLVVRLMSLGTDKALRRRTVDIAQIKPGDRVLDVGCGTGDLTIAAKARAGSTGSVIGIDASPEMIAEANSKVAKAGINVEFRLDRIEALTFADNSFDVVLSSLMMHHLPDDLKRAGMNEIYRVLRPGGHLLIVDMKRTVSPRSRLLATWMHHQMVETGAQDLAVMMREAGFTQIETRDAWLGILGFVRGEAGK